MVSLTSRMQRAAFLGLLAVLASAPFERLEPVLVLPGQSLTNLEIVALTAWLLWLAARWLEGGLRRIEIPGLLPLSLLLATFVASALLVAAHPDTALRFTARQALGLAVYGMVVTQVNSFSRLRLALIALVVPGLAVALLGILEYREVGAVESLLQWFRPTGFFVAGRTRISSTLQYPTITSMYLELTLGWGLALLLQNKPVGRQLRAPWAVGALVVMGAGILLTMTRAGVATLFFMLLWVTAVAVRRGRSFETKSLVLLSAALAAVLVVVLQGSDLWLRLSSPDETWWYQAEYRVPSRLQLEAGSLSEVEVSIRNQGRVAWTREPANPVRLGYHWLNESGEKTVVFEGARTDLPAEVVPGGWIRLRARVFVPPAPGTYQLIWDMLKEHRFWFSMAGVSTGRTVVAVTPAAGRVRSLPPGDQLSLPAPRFSISRSELWEAALKMIRRHPLLGVGPDNFRLTYGAEVGVADADRSYHAHNLWLEVFVSTGLVGGLLCLWLLSRLLLCLIHLGRRDTDPTFSYYIGGSAATAAILVHGLVDYFLEFNPLIVVIWATFGLIVAAERVSRKMT